MIKDLKVWYRDKLLKNNIDYTFNAKTGKTILKEPILKRDVKIEYDYYMINKDS